MRTVAAALVCGTMLFASGADTAKVSRAKLANAEKLINTQLASMVPEEPYFLIGLARGAYLDGVGVVFSAEINLATGPSLSPFKQTISKEEIQKHRDKKEVRLPLLRNMMVSIVGNMATYLETLPPNEEVIFAVTLLRYPWEDPSGQVSQIVMRMQRGKLLDAQKLNLKLDSAIKTQEY